MVTQEISVDNIDENKRMIYKTLGVIIQDTQGKYWQVALDQEKCDCLFDELRNLFDGGIVKILPDELEGLSLTEIDM